MATVACPGCGLPRAEAEIGAKPCPVCDAAPVAAGAPRARPAPTEPDPTEGLPADVSELNAPAKRTPRRAASGPPKGGSRVWLAAATFLLGAVCGVGGVLGIQAIDLSNPKPEEPEVAAKPEGEAPPPQPARLPIAPMPHEGGIKPIAFVEPDGEFQLPIALPPPGVIVTHTVNMPEETYVIPTMKRGEHIVLKGKAKTLRVHLMDDGAVLDASELEASVITVTGKIDNGSTLKLNAPNGTVHITGKIDGKSRLEINARDGEVKFMVPSTGNREGSRIDNGSTVAITARTVEFKGDISGAGTKVSVTLNRNAWLKFAAIGGTATLEYKSQVAGWSPPDVVAGTVARTATFRKVE